MGGKYYFMCICARWPTLPTYFHQCCYYFFLNCKNIVMTKQKFIDYCSAFWNNFCQTAIQVFLVADSQRSFYGNGRLIDLTFMRAKNSWSANYYIFSRRKLGSQIRRLCLPSLKIDYMKFFTVQISFSFHDLSFTSTKTKYIKLNTKT